MATLKKWYRNLSIKNTFVLLASFSILLASVLSVFVVLGLANVRSAYFESIGHPISYVDFGSDLDEINLILVEKPTDDFTATFLTLFTFFSPLLVLAAVMVLTGFLFYLTKLKRPIDLLMFGVDHIMQEDLDFKLDYQSEDELGKLCASFETMRGELVQRYKNEWLVVEERENLNRAFAHDVRTPVTIIKGHLQVLDKNVSAHEVEKSKILQTIKLSLANLEKIERYLEMQTSIQRLSDITPLSKEVGVEAYFEHIHEDFELFARKSNIDLKFDVNLEKDCYVFDADVLVRILENVFTNAVRFAENEVTVLVQSDAEQIHIDVMDDGTGFDSTNKEKAFLPFYTENRAEDVEHSGLGLYTAQVLVRKMGGSIDIMDAERGGHVRVSIPIN
jgi:two-component system, OmpR family, lantibiotic biosynthesis sensor histidine kinase NisK/SpaK